MSGWNYFFLFAALFIGLLLGGQLYFYRKMLILAAESARPKRNRWLAHIIFGAFNLPVVLVLGIRPKLTAIPGWILDTMVYPFYIWQFSLFLAFLVVTIIWTVKFPFTLIGLLMKRISTPRQWIESVKEKDKILNYDLRRRMFVRKSATVLIGAAFVGSTYGTYRRDDYSLEEISIPIKDLPAAFEGFTIGLISDIHSSIFMTKEQMQTYARAVNSMKTDLIAVTGDFVNSMVEEVYPFAEAFNELRAPHGVYGVLGNHDFFTKNVDKVAREVDDCGIKLLRDDRVMIEKDGQKIALLGVDDVGSYRRAGAVFDVSLKGADAAAPKILMCHRPYFFQQAADRKIDLTLSGHTHGGQIVFARIGDSVLAAARFASPYVSGLYELDGSQMYVSRGIGTVGVPMRFNCPPELTKITLVKA